MTTIAIDGPAGAGKSTVARALAERLGLAHLDTGAMFRAVAFAAMLEDIDLDDVDRIGELAETIDIEVSERGVFVDGHDAGVAIRTPAVAAAASAIATNSRVRAELRDRQRGWARQHQGGVVEGRDIGSVVLPDADLKLYLTASPMIRATRRVSELGGDVHEIASAIAERDLADSTRADSPLREADGSVVLDTSGMSIEEVLQTIETLLRGAS